VIPSSLSWGLGDYHSIIITARRIIMPKFGVFAEEVVTYYAEVEATDATEANRIANSGEIEWGYPTDGEFFRVVEVRNA
jgi:hypothetical protein